MIKYTCHTTAKTARLLNRIIIADNFLICAIMLLEINMLSILLNFSLKDWLIAITLLILMFCIIEIRKLKKTIAKETQKRLIPQLNLEFNSDIQHKTAGFHLKNESFFLARNITIKDIELILSDFGFKKTIILKFKDINLLRPEEKIQLEFKVFDINGEPLPEVTEKIIPHLISPSFKIKIYYSNVENLKFCAVFLKTKDIFHTESHEIIA